MPPNLERHTTVTLLPSPVVWRPTARSWSAHTHPELCRDANAKPPIDLSKNIPTPYTQYNRDAYSHTVRQLPQTLLRVHELHPIQTFVSRSASSNGIPTNAVRCMVHCDGGSIPFCLPTRLQSCSRPFEGFIYRILFGVLCVVCVECRVDVEMGRFGTVSCSGRSSSNCVCALEYVWLCVRWLVYVFVCLNVCGSEKLVVYGQLVEGTKDRRYDDIILNVLVCMLKLCCSVLWIGLCRFIFAVT